MYKFKLLLSLLFIVIGYCYSLDCCVPVAWSGSSVTVNSANSIITNKNYYYDYDGLRIRVDLVTSDGIFNQTTYSNYANLTTTGNEWLFDYNLNTCVQKGPDFWNSQCFGDSYGLPFQSSTDGVNVFSNPTNGITVQADNSCLPISFSSELSLSKTKFYNTVNTVDDSVFNIPSIFFHKTRNNYQPTPTIKISTNDTENDYYVSDEE